MISGAAMTTLPTVRKPRISMAYLQRSAMAMSPAQTSRAAMSMPVISPPHGDGAGDAQRLASAALVAHLDADADIAADAEAGYAEHSHDRDHRQPELNGFHVNDLLGF
jgi:hypothetical protein